MPFHPFEVDIPHIAYALLGGFVVFFGMFSLFIREKLYIGEACWAFLFGVVIGPYGANVFNPRGWGNGNTEVVNTITLEFTRVVLAIGVFAIGVELPKAYMQRHWKSLFYLLVPVMTWGWFVSAGLIFGLIPNLSFLSALVVAACLTPTDPILAAAVVGGKYADKHVPAHLRHLLAAESGCNDGAAFPFLFISLYLVLDDTTGEAVKDWFLELWLYQIILGVVFGAIIGIGFRHLMKFCERKDLIDRQSYVAQYVSLALLTIGTTTMLGSDDLLAAFSCGTAFAWDGFFNKQTEESVFSSVIDLLFNVAAFVYVGAWMPFNMFNDAELTISVWRLIVIAILVLVLRRLPVMIAFYKLIPDVKTFREAIFSGHFGPIGIGAVFISTLAVTKLETPESPPANQQQMLAASIQPIVAFMVLVSVTIHGLSIPFFSLGRRVHSLRTWSRQPTREAQPEWAQHTRHIRPGEDIVINRDDAIERGEYSPTAEEKRSAASSGESPGVKEKDMVGEPLSEDTRRPDGEDYRAQSPPDGEDVVQEWKEGPHRIIEKRAGPGEEVEVEVQKHAFDDNVETTTSSFKGEHMSVHQSAKEHLERILHAPVDLEHRMQDGLHAFEDSAKRGFEEAVRVVSPTPKPAPKPAEEPDEDAWASDTDDPQASTSQAAASTSRSPDRKAKSKAKAFFGGRTRRRQSHSTRTRPPHIVTPHRDDDTLPRGRTHAEGAVDPARLSISDDHDREREGRAMRPQPLERLRSSEARRAGSPARSVRFAWDELESPRRSPLGTPGWMTPADPMSGFGTPLHSPGTPRSGTPPPHDDENGAEKRMSVRFER